MRKYFSKGEYWFGFATTKTKKNGKSVVRLIWGRVLTALALMGLAGWVLLTMAGFFFVRHQMDFREGNYVNVVFPWRWDIYRESLGDAHVQKAFQAIEQEDWRNFRLYLRRGMAHSPGNMEGRRLLAELELSRNSILEAANILRRGFDFEAAYENPEYVEFSLPVFLRAGEEEIIFSLLEEAEKHGFGDELQKKIALFASRAAWNLGDTGKARSILERYRLTEQADGLMFSLRLEWEDGHREEVLNQLQGWLNEAPRNKNLLQTKISFLQRAEKWDQARQWAILYSLRHPEALEPSLLLMQIDMQLGNEERLTREFVNLLEGRQSSERVRALAGVVRESGKTALGELLLDNLPEAHEERLLATLAVLESALSTKSEELAEKWLGKAESHPQINQNPAHQAYFQGLSLVWHQWQENEADANNSMNSLLSSVRAHPNPALRTSAMLTDLGEYNSALRIVREGQRRHPLQQEFYSQEVKIHVALGDFDALMTSLKRLLEMRQPDVQTLRSAKEFLSSDRFLFRPERQEILNSLAQKNIG